MLSTLALVMLVVLVSFPGREAVSSQGASTSMSLPLAHSPKPSKQLLCRTAKQT